MKKLGSGQGILLKKQLLTEGRRMIPWFHFGTVLLNQPKTWQTKTKSKQIIHIISFEPITSKASANSFNELSMTTVSIDVIGEFWRAMKRELVDIV